LATAVKFPSRAPFPLPRGRRCNSGDGRLLRHPSNPSLLYPPPPTDGVDAGAIQPPTTPNPSASVAGSAATRALFVPPQTSASAALVPPVPLPPWVKSAAR
jgi:hypothetical protein